MKRLFGHPVTRRTRRIARRVVVTCAVILAVVFVTTLSVDLGPALRGRAEVAATQYMGRPMHIGRLSVHLWRGQFVVEDLVIEGLTPESRPFLLADRIAISLPWSTLINRRVVFDAIEMRGWRMHVETFPDGRHNFPRFTRNTPRGPSAWTTTLQYVRAYRGEFSYSDHGTPWSVVTRNLDVIVTRPTSEYRGQARFSNGTIAIQNYVPMSADLRTSFRIVDGKIVLDRSYLTTDGAESEITGEVDIARWPEQTYQIQSQIQLPKMREIFWANDTFSLFGESRFTGTFHLFKETVNGRTRTGRDLTGNFHSVLAGINDFRFSDLRGSVRWVPESLEVTNATAGVYGGTARFGYRMAPLGQAVRATATFDAEYEQVDLTTFTDFLETEGIRLAGRASGRNLLEWPLGRYAEHRGNGAMRVEPPGNIVDSDARDVRPPAGRGRTSRQRVGRVQQPPASRSRSVARPA